MHSASESHICASSWATGPGRAFATITATTSETPGEMPPRPEGKPVDTSTAMLISIPLLRIARDISPLTGSYVMNIRNSGWGAMTLDPPPSVEPHSFREMKPPGSKRGFRRSKTLGLQRLASRKITHVPSRMHRVSVPSTHSNLPAARASLARNRSPRTFRSLRSLASGSPRCLGSLLMSI